MQIKTLLLCGLLLSGLTGLQSQAQVQIGSTDIPSGPNPGKISKDDFAAFRKTTTLFTLQTKDYENIAAFEKAIGNVWKVTPFKIIQPNEIKQYLRQKGKYSFATFDGFAVQRSGQAISTTNTHLSYDIWMPEFSKKDGSFKRQNIYGRIMLHVDNTTYAESMKLFNSFGAKKRSKAFTEYLYTKTVFSNWSPGLLSGPLALINKDLSEEKLRSVFAQTNDKNLLKPLAEDTLFIPDYVKVHFNMMSGKETLDEDKDEDDLAKSYPYPVKYIDKESLSQKILSGEKNIHYLVYVKSSADKYVSVYNTAGEELYAHYTPASYNFKNKDLRKIADLIRKK